MILLKVICFAIVYAAIGGLICGLMDDEDNMIWYMFIWPLFFVILLIVLVAELPRRIGKEFHDRWSEKE